MESEWTAALHVLGKVFSSTPWQVVSDVLVHYGDVFAVMLAGYIIHWLPGSVHDVLRQRFVMASHAVQLALGLAVGWIAYEVLALGGTPFIYFQF